MVAASNVEPGGRFDAVYVTVAGVLSGVVSSPFDVRSGGTKRGLSGSNANARTVYSCPSLPSTSWTGSDTGAALTFSTVMVVVAVVSSSPLPTSNGTTYV